MRKRIAANARMEGESQSGDLISFLMRQGLGEATDVLLIDETLCVGCDNCEKACAETHGGTSRLDRAAGPTFAHVHVPTSCRHCEDPHCMKDCPPDAIRRAQNGEVYIRDNCIGCGNCERNCPYGVIHMAAKPPEKPGLAVVAALRSRQWSWRSSSCRSQRSGQECGARSAEEGGEVRHVQGPVGRTCLRARMPHRRRHPGEPRVIRRLREPGRGTFLKQQALGLMHQSFLSYRRKRYLWVALFLCAASIAAYAWHAPRSTPNGGTWLGYTLGGVGAVLILWLTLLGIRKRSYKSRLGTVQGWVSAHVYLGLALIVIVTLHTGFQFGWNIHTVAYVLMMIVIGSGLVGISAYLRLPTQMSENRASLTLRPDVGGGRGSRSTLRQSCREAASRFRRCGLQ